MKFCTRDFVAIHTGRLDPDVDETSGAGLYCYYGTGR